MLTMKPPMQFQLNTNVYKYKILNYIYQYVFVIYKSMILFVPTFLEGKNIN
jgi:hypothetical protein